jgi:single-stranded DNA-binding protein
MNNLNSVLIEGNLTRDPLLTSTSKGTPYCAFTIASNRFYKHDVGLEKEVSFLEVESWAKLAEHVEFRPEFQSEYRKETPEEVVEETVEVESID